MQDSKEVREMAKIFREAADVLDEMADFAENRKEMTKEEDARFQIEDEEHHHIDHHSVIRGQIDQECIHVGE